MGNSILLHLFTVELLNFIQTPLLSMDNVMTKAPYTLQLLVIINDSIIILWGFLCKKIRQKKL